MGLGVQQDPKAHVEVEDSCHPGCSERERFNVGTRAWSSSETQEAVSHPRLLQGKEKRAKGTRADGYIRQPGGVPDHHMGSLGKCQSQARLHALLEVLATAPEIKPASQEWALHGDMQDMDPRMYRNPGKSPQVATPTGFKPVMPTS